MGWFQSVSKAKRNSIAQFYIHALELPTRDFVRLVKELLEEADSASAAMCVVAHENLGWLLPLARKMAKEYPGHGIPTDLDSCIFFLAKDMPVDELESRRAHWFLWALLVKRATALSEHDEALHKDIVEIWIRLAEGGRCLRTLLKQNILWSEEEKAYFSQLTPAKDGAWYVLCLMVPSWLKHGHRINAYADSLGIYYF